MDPFVFFLVLTAAVLHAGWNALIKSGGDRWVRLALTNCLGIVLGLVFLPFVDFPNAEAWPFILSSVAVHQVYFLFVGACEHDVDFGFLRHIAARFRNTGVVIIRDLDAFVELSDEQLNTQLLGSELLDWLKS